MSTYLGRLVNRLIQPEAEIQPRLPGLFEPSPLRTEMVGLEAAADASTPRVKASQGDAEEAESALQAESRPGDWQARQISSTQLSAPEKIGTKRSEPAQLAPPETQAFAAPEQLEPSPVEAQAASVPAAALSAVPADSSSENAGRDAPKEAARRDILHVSGAPAEARGARPEAILPHPADMKPVQPVENHPAEPLSTPTQPIQTRLATPASSAPKPAIPHIQPAQAEPGDAPQIHVTIGRIEVRAANPPPAAPRKAAIQHRPVVSLEAYLKRRQGDSK
jgi:hypothetical protein